MFLADGGKSVDALRSPSGEPWRPEMMSYKDATELGCNALWQLHLERNDLCKMYLERWKACEGLDGILSPTTAYSTVEHGDFQHVGYTGIWNVMDYSAVTFPSGVVVDKTKDVLSGNEKSFGVIDDDVRSKCEYFHHL